MASHQDRSNPISQWNNKVDELSRVAPLQNESIMENWERLLEWLHIKRGHKSSKDLYCEAHARGWPLTRENCHTCISVCSLCQSRRDKHPLDQPPLHIKSEKGLWDTWQIDYIGPFHRSKGKQYILVRVEVLSRLVQAEAFACGMGENTVQALNG